MEKWTLGNGNETNNDTSPIILANFSNIVAGKVT